MLLSCIGNCRGYCNNLPEKSGDVGLKILAFLHFGQVLLDIGEDAMELRLVCLFACIEFDESALKHLNEVAHYGIVELLLLPSGEPRIDRHLFLFIFISARK